MLVQLLIGSGTATHSPGFGCSGNHIGSGSLGGGTTEVSGGKAATGGFSAGAVMVELGSGGSMVAIGSGRGAGGGVVSGGLGEPITTTGPAGSARGSGF